jgi:polysaccharide chain length determinant protein (PEP-CTERM system associated)
MHELVQQVLANLKTVWHFRWYAVISAWVIAAGGWIVVYKMPNRYEADARVYVDTQSVLRPLLSGLTVDSNLEQMIMIMSRTLMSRPNLEKLIQMAGLDGGVKTDEEKEYLVTRLASAISIKGAGRDLYAISYVDKDPQIAKRVVQSVLKLFMDGSLVNNREDSDSARRFIDEQLKNYRDKLEASETAITEFKRRNLGLMPGQGPGYFTRLDEAKAALKQAKLELREAENSRDSIARRLASESEVAAVLDDRVAGEGSTESDIDVRIRTLGQKLDELRTTYTEEHPDIVAIARIIGQLKDQRELEIKQKRAEVKQNGPLPISQAKNPVYQQLTISLTAAEASLAAMRTRVAEYTERYIELQTAANAVPEVEAAYVQLTRDYEVNKTRYDELLKRRDTARITEDVDKTNATGAFRVIDPPQVPLRPKSPKRGLLMTIVLFLAIAGGLAVAFLLSQIRPTFNDERKLSEISGVRVLGTVPMVWNDSQKARRHLKLVSLLFSLASLLSAYAAIMTMLMLTTSRP